MKEQIEFLTSIYSGLKSGLYICLSTKRRNRWKDHFFKTPVSEEVLEDFFQQYDTHRFDLYFCPHAFREPRRKKDLSVPTKYLWSDLDNANPKLIKPRPQIAWASSPNRFACLWILKDIPTLEETEKMNKRLAYSVGADHGGWDITQVLRIPGTRNHKYPDAPYGKLLWHREIPYESIEITQQSDIDSSDILRKYNISPFTIKRTYSEAKEGSRSEMLWKLENELIERGLSKDEVFIVISDSPWNKFRNRPEQLKREIEKAWETHLHDEPEDKPKKKKSKSVYQEEESSHTLTLINLDDVEPEVVEWLWYPYIPRGKLTMIEGDPGLGKSWLTMALASYISRGKPLPYQIDPEEGPVLIMSAEDGLADTIKPRLITLKANTKNILAIPEAVSFTENGCKAIDEAIKKIKPILIIIDPLVAYLGGKVDLHKANETREVMARLTRIAEENRVSVVLVRHLTKGGKEKAIYRGLGSIDLTAAVRSVLAIGRNPQDPNDGRVICHIKSNLAPLGKPLAYTLDSSDKKHPFEFGEEIDVDVNEVLGQQASSGKGSTEKAMEFLQTVLKDDEALPSIEIKREAEARGISEKSLKKAKRALKIVMVNEEGIYKWKLPNT